MSGRVTGWHTAQFFVGGVGASDLRFILLINFLKGSALNLEGWHVELRAQWDFQHYKRNLHAHSSQRCQLSSARFKYTHWKTTSSKLNFGHHHSLPCWYGYCHCHFQLLSVGNIKQQCSHGRGCKFSAISPSSHPPPCAICQAPLTVIPLHQSVIKCRVNTQRQKTLSLARSAESGFSREKVTYFYILQYCKHCIIFCNIVNIAYYFAILLTLQDIDVNIAG